MQTCVTEQYPDSAMLRETNGAPTQLHKMTDLNNSEIETDLINEKMQLGESAVYLGMEDSSPPSSHPQNYLGYTPESDKFDSDLADDGHCGSMDQLMMEKNSKTSRRKQSKPIRVQHSSVDQMELPQPENEQTPPKNFEHDSSSFMDTDHSIACVICSEMFPSQQHMKEHFMSVHASIMSAGLSPPSFPTMYHRLGHDINHEHDKVVYDHERRNESGGSGGSGASGDQQDSGVESGAPSMNIHSKESGELNPGEISRSQNGTRIFHADAYCELCDREFCNKYFLKTHKANKHGIYDSPLPMVSQPGSLPAPMFPMFFSQPGPIHPPPEPLPTSLSSMILQPKDRLSPPIPMELPKQSPPKPLTEQSNGQQPQQQQQLLDDYCEICQKHFCNKYYLRKHKQDVHGIVSEPHSKRCRSAVGDSLAHLNNMAASPVLLPQNIPNSMTNVMLINPFAPLMALPQMPNASLLSAHLPQLPQTSTPIKSPNHQTMIGQNENRDINSSSPGAVSQEDLRRMGVLNNEAFCEICRKEFCNKYFLKIHKANKHGIFSHEDHFLMNGMRQSSPTGIHSSMSTIPTSTSPIDSSNNNNALNLKINNNDEKKEDQHPRSPGTPTRSESLDREKESDIINHNIMRSSPAAMCDICNKDFESSQMLRIHHLTAHNNFREESKHLPSFPMFDADKPGTQLPQSLPTDQPSPIPGMISDVPGMPTMFSSMVAAKLADRVMCDICNKEVCNKYFLKTHKIKMHGIDPNSFARDINARDENGNSNAHTPSEIGSPEKSSPTDGKKFESENLEKEHIKQQMQQFQSDMRQMQHEQAMNEHFQKQQQQQQLEKHSTPVKMQRHEELLKMGIDPEAYCELCKKEFCSKYFLRTHMFNMHGIRVEGLKEKDVKKVQEKQVRELKDREMKILDLSRPPPPLPSQVVPPQHMHPFASLQMHMHEQFAQSRMRQEESNDSVDNKSVTSDGSGKSRDPANMIRVKCDICSKELCNKYFLRTHKLNKHGILDESLARDSYPMFDFPKNLVDNWMNGRPTYIDKYVKKEPFDGFPPEMKAKYGLPGSPGEAKPNIFQSSHIGSLSPPHQHHQPQERQCDSPDGSINSIDICHICHRRFKNVKWLKSHLYTEHNIKDDHMHGFSESPFQACELCGMVFPDRSMLRMHLLQVHRVQMPSLSVHDMPKPLDLGKSPPLFPSPMQNSGSTHTPSLAANSISLSLKRKYSKNLKQKLHSCSHCDYKTRWLSNIYSHEERKHSINKTTQGKYTCNKCFKCFRYEHSLYRHNIEYHKGKYYGLSSLSLAANRNRTNEKLRNRFRCANCNERFPSRQTCRLHIRTVHKPKKQLSGLPRKYQCEQCDYSTNLTKNIENHMKVKHKKDSLSVNGDANANTTEVDENELPVSYATPCDLKTQSSFIMQPFTLKDDTNTKQFVTAVVYLPVKQKINEPINVTFELSPTEQ